MRVGRGVLVAVVVALVAQGGAQPATAAKRKPRGPLLTATVEPKLRGPKVARSFLGFSQEYQYVLNQIGRSRQQGGLNTTLAALFDQLGAFGGGPPVLRLGGGSTDGSWWNPTNQRRPTGIDYSIDFPFVGNLAAFQKLTGSPLILGLNLGMRDPQLAVDWAKAALQYMPPGSIDGFEVGNEPDIFDTRPFDLRSPDPGWTRPKGYSAKDYLPEIKRFHDRLTTEIPGIALAGPSICCMPDWVNAIPGYLKQEKGRVGLVTAHRYPLFSCEKKPGERGYPTAKALLTPNAIRVPLKDFQAMVQAAKKQGLKLRATETNSVACGGAVGASDVFAAALWGADWMFALQAIGVVGADFHSSGPLYAPFITQRAGDRWAVVAKPLYYGMLLFAEATANRATSLPSVLFTLRKRTPGTNVRVWAFRDDVEHVARVVVLNKDTSRHGTAAIAVPKGRGRGRLKRLTAPSLKDKRGLKWGGQSFAAPTVDGQLTGTERVSRVRRGRGGRYRFSMAAGSAAMLTVDLR